MKKKVLTSTQEKVLSFLKNYLREKGFPPTLREIASHFGLKGPKAPQKTVAILERKGYLRRVPGGSRAIEILGVPTPRGQTLSVPIVGRVTAGEPILPLRISKGTLTLIEVSSLQKMSSSFGFMVIV